MMDTYKCVLALFLLLLTVAQASSGSPELGINAKSSLEEVNEWLKKVRHEFETDNPNAGLVEVNNHAMAMLFLREYPHENYLLSKVREAITKGCYAFLDTLYPIDKIIWWRDDGDLASLLAETMQHAEWESRQMWDEYARSAGWRLRFRDLIRLRSGHIYKNKWFRDLVFKDELFKKNFREIIQEAYDSNNVPLLSAVPYPSEEYPLEEDQAVFFWSLVYGQTWCPAVWSDYINTIGNIDGALRKLEIFDVVNPKVFKHNQVELFLDRNRIRESLETAIKYDSLSFAQYLREKHGFSGFKRMALECPKTHTRRERLSRYTRPYYHKPVLSRVYNFLLENGKVFDYRIIKFGDYPIVNEYYFDRLSRRSLDKEPLENSDFALYGTTIMGIRFLKMFLRGEFMMTWFGDFEIPLQLTSRGLDAIKLEILDVEAFNLITMKYRSLTGEPFSREHLRSCVARATRQRDIGFLTSVLTHQSYIHEVIDIVIAEAIKGSVAVLDWIFKTQPEILRDLDFEAIQLPCSLSEVPLLAYFFNKSSPCNFLIQYAVRHLRAAAESGNEEHYDQVIAIKGVVDSMELYGYYIPESSGEERLAPVKDVPNLYFPEESSQEEFRQPTLCCPGESIQEEVRQPNLCCVWKSSSEEDRQSGLCFSKDPESGPEREMCHFEESESSSTPGLVGFGDENSTASDDQESRISQTDNQKEDITQANEGGTNTNHAKRRAQASQAKSQTKGVKRGRPLQRKFTKTHGKWRLQWRN